MSITEPFKRRPVENLLSARSVAIVGASPKGRWPMGIYRNLKKAKYNGKLFLVNPNYKEIAEDPCYPNLAALPEPPEHLLMLIPTKAVLSTLEEAAKLGSKAATIYSAGFGEGTDPDGTKRGEQLRELCDRTGMVTCGPNCMGSFSMTEGLWSFPTAVPLLKKGPVGLIFQSGGSLGNWIKGASERGIGFTYAVSSGNETSLDLVDYLSFLVDDDETKLIALMVEGVRRPREFMTVAAQALKKNKPILVIKLGRSEMGKRQAISHTGALAGADEVFDAACKRLGLVRVPTLEDLTETTLAFMPGRIPRGSRAAIVVNSGGMKGLLCDHTEELNTDLAPLSEATRQAVRPLIPPELVVENPLECGVAGFGDEENFIKIVKFHADDDNVDLLAIHGELPRFPEKREATLFKNLNATTDKPILAFARSTYSLTDESRVFQDDAGIPFLQGIKPTLRALAGLGFYGKRRGADIGALPPASGKAEDLDGEKLNALLQRHGIALPRQATAASAAEAAEKAKQIGFPVALKLVAPEIVHKTESGAVVLGLKNVAEVEAAGKQLLGKASKAHLLLQEMVQGTEVLVGARSDPQYGPFLMVGLGGIFVEVLKDVAIRLLPVSESEAVEMLKELRGYKILTGVRGQPPRDVRALARAMAGVSELFAAHREHLSDFEINPLMVRPEGQGVVAVDVRLVRK
jgi:acetate---CoA ligase (ADP-forming)